MAASAHHAPIPLIELFASMSLATTIDTATLTSAAFRMVLCNPEIKIDSAALHALGFIFRSRTNMDTIKNKIPVHNLTDCFTFPHAHLIAPPNGRAARPETQANQAGGACPLSRRCRRRLEGDTAPPAPGGDCGRPQEDCPPGVAGKRKAPGLPRASTTASWRAPCPRV